jgi:hypothetical protein
MRNATVATIGLILVMCIGFIISAPAQKNASGTAGGPDTAIQFNDGTYLNGDAAFVFNKTTKAVTGTGAAEFDGGMTLCSGCTAQTFRKSATDAAVDLASVASGACTAARSVTIAGSALGGTCLGSAATALQDGTFIRCAVTATDTVKWQLCNLSGGAVDRSSDDYKLTATN